MKIWPIIFFKNWILKPLCLLLSQVFRPSTTTKLTTLTIFFHIQVVTTSKLTIFLHLWVVTTSKLTIFLHLWVVTTSKLTIFFHPQVVTTSKLTIFFHPRVVTTSKLTIFFILGLSPFVLCNCSLIKMLNFFHTSQKKRALLACITQQSCFNQSWTPDPS